MSPLDKLKDELYQEHFYEADEGMDGNLDVFSEGAEKVLESMQDLKNNPDLLHYVIKCFKHSEINIHLQKYSLIMINETMEQYKEHVHGSIESYNKALKRGIILTYMTPRKIRMVFNSVGEARDYAKTQKENDHAIIPIGV
jgi:hypothetical protein